VLINKKQELTAAVKHHELKLPGDRASDVACRAQESTRSQARQRQTRFSQIQDLNKSVMDRNMVLTRDNENIVKANRDLTSTKAQLASEITSTRWRTTPHEVNAALRSKNALKSDGDALSSENTRCSTGRPVASYGSGCRFCISAYSAARDSLRRSCQRGAQTRKDRLVIRRGRVNFRRRDSASAL